MVDATKVCSIEVNTGHAGTKKYPLFIENKVNKEGKRTEGDCAILLGKNGSGKSTIARALSTEAEGTLFLDGDNKSVNGDLSNVYVFDENFISKNFRRLDGDHLNPIILLGDSVQIQDKIDDLMEEFKKHQVNIDGLEKEIGRLKESKEKKFKYIRGILSKNDGDYSSWKSRTGLYEKNRRNLFDKYIIELINKPSDGSRSLDTLFSQFHDKVDKLKGATTFEKIDWSPNKIYLYFDINKIEQALLKVRSTRNSDTGNTLYTRVRDSKINISDLTGRVNSIFGEDILFCPTCFQGIENNYKELVIDAINKYVDDIQNNETIQALKSLKFDHRPEKQFPPKQIDVQEEILSDLEFAWNKLYSICDEINVRIQNKIDDPERRVSVTDLDPKDILRSIEENLQKIQDLVNEYNSQGDKIDSLHDECIDLNEELAVREIFADSSIWKKINEELNDKSKKLNEEKENIGIIERKIKEKQLYLRNEKEASERINELLSVVFGNNGISLEPDVDLGYRVVNNNKDVPPNRLSTGEQNILSLCYFFVNIANDKKFEESYGSNQLIVLDDPISSFDYDNKYGAIALLGYIARSLFQEGSKTKLLIMTHDPSVASDISKFMKDIRSGRVLCWEFQNDDLKQVNFDYVDEYKRILSCMCDFALEEASVGKIPTANEVRRVWEAFLRFELGEKNLSDASTSKMIRTYFNEIGEPESKFLNIFPSRTFINPDSHSGSQMLYFNFDLTPTLGSRDLKRFVREIICFMQIVSPYHIASRLEGSSESIEARRKKLNKLRKDVIENL
ncbi:AAA family ATPase [Rothia dentocariosa]|jgi:hypothetical protein|uniref:AAA family ATPase n=1 Tax=Rothia dentocariosa TaxID=2047 RepID=UPI0024478BF9|nr:AAA family ATPase [Rothia dentocariosa]